MPSTASQQGPVAVCWICPGGRVPSRWAESEPGVESLSLHFHTNLRCSRGGEVGVNLGPLSPGEHLLFSGFLSCLPVPCAHWPLSSLLQQGASVELARLGGFQRRQSAGMAKGREV